MSEKKLSGELRRCLEGNDCADCTCYEQKSVLTCRGLLQKAYETVKGYEEMERLTFVDEDGNVLFDNPVGFPEDVGFTIRELAENEEYETLDNIAQRLANCEQRLKHYEDLEKQGKLLKLPCAVGDSVYVLRIDNTAYMMNNEKVWEIIEEKFEIRHFDCINKTVFLTRPEAERALAETEGKNGD